ncbi:MAG: ABC transporter ATP-binding protein [bacterium]
MSTSKPIIEVKHLSKVYNIGHEQKSAPGTLTFRDSIVQTMRKPLEIFTGHKMKQEKFWALKDINLDVQPGDTIGLIGKNGSGKSTLLKVLSRIVEPTEGEITMRGRSASLLEVGTGFHPELSGRENIFFNGAILGMSQKEIKSKFDEIVAFSGVEKFLDTPVKFYSSGMYVRLAFAVAAHLEPDILIVDEVLAVGDAEFQKKSLGKMKDVTADKNRTVIFVSHNMEAIQSICNKVAWVSNGEIKEFGDTEKVVASYQAYDSGANQLSVAKRKDRQGTGVARLTGLKVEENIVRSKELTIKLAIGSNANEAFVDFKLSLDIYDSRGTNIANLLNSTIGKKLTIKPGKNIVNVRMTNFNLVPGEYTINTFLAKDQYNSEIFDWLEGAAVLHVPAYDYYDQGAPPSVNGKVSYVDYEID